MNTTPDTIEDEVLRDIEKPENPYKRYRVEFPFTCTFTIAEDGHNTRVTIELEVNICTTQNQRMMSVCN